MNANRPFERVVARNFLMLGSGELGARVISFGVMIYIARQLGPEAYGVVGFALAIILYFVRVSDFGIESLGPREIAEDPERIRRIAPSVLTTRLIISSVLAAGLVGVGFLLLPQPEGAVLGIFGLTLLPVGGSTRWIHIGLEKVGLAAIARTVGEGVRALLVFWLVHEAADVINVPLAQFIGDTLAAVIMGIWLYKRGVKLTWHIDWTVVVALFRRTWPLVATMLLGLVIYNSDLMFLKGFRDDEEVGFYLAAFTLITFLGNLGTTYSSSLLPTLTRAGKEGRQQALYQTSMAQTFAVTMPIAVGGYLLGTQIIDFWFGEVYQASGFVLQILVWSIPFLVWRGVLQAVLISIEQQDRVLRVALWSAALNVLLNVVLIPRYGMVGAAYSTVVTEAVRMLLAQLYVWFGGYSLTRFGRFWRPLVAATLMAVVLLMLELPSMWVAIAVGALVYGAALTLTGGIQLRGGRLPMLKV